MFDRIIDFFKNIDIYYKSAFRAYLFGCILSIIAFFIITYCIFVDDVNAYKEILRWLLLDIFLILVALNIENINVFKNNQIYKNLLICLVLIIFGIFIYDIIPLYYDEYMKILQYCALLLALFALFVSFNLRFHFYSFFDFVASGLFAFGIFALLNILIGISLLSIDFLFDFDVYDIYLTSIALIACISFIFFIGKVALLNHFLFGESKKENPSKKTKYLLLMLSIFSYFYASLLILYFLMLFFGFEPQYSAVHLIIWFSFFGIVLFWLNQVLDFKYLNRFFLTLLFLLNIIALYSIIIRISEYGFTPSRYFVLISCVFLMISIVLSLRNYLKILFYLFAILCIFSAFGSFNAIKISIDSQLKILKNLELSKANYKRISNIYFFLDDYLPQDTLIDYKHFLDSNFSFSKTYIQDYKVPSVIDVSGFDTLIKFITLKHGGESSFYNIDFSINNNRLEIRKGEIIVEIDDFYDFIKKHDTATIKECIIDCSQFIIESKKARLYIRYIVFDDENKNIDEISFDILLK